jgi:hypothetical protein
MIRLVPLLLVIVALASCTMNEDERENVLESAGRTNYEIGRGTVVRDLRSPSDTGRLIYEPPVNLSQRSGAAAGAVKVWAPFGIATPDTTPPDATRNR